MFRCAMHPFFKGSSLFWQPVEKRGLAPAEIKKNSNSEHCLVPVPFFQQVLSFDKECSLALGPTGFFDLAPHQNGLTPTLLPFDLPTRYLSVESQTPSPFRSPLGLVEIP